MLFFLIKLAQIKTESGPFKFKSCVKSQSMLNSHQLKSTVEGLDFRLSHELIRAQTD